MSHIVPLIPDRSRHLYLTGFMGAGKSTIGHLLAQRLGWVFHDLDHQVELHHGQRIADIFRTRGEAGFRRWESAAFAQLALDSAPYVMATGGGTLMDAANFELARRTGVVIYLIVDFPTALKRTQNDLNRPLLADGDALQDPETLRRLFHHRLPFYRRARIHVDAAHGTQTEIVERIIAALPSQSTLRAEEQHADSFATRVTTLR